MKLEPTGNKNSIKMSNEKFDYCIQLDSDGVLTIQRDEGGMQVETTLSQVFLRIYPAEHKDVRK
jgi:hypothetical protein